MAKYQHSAPLIPLERIQDVLHWEVALLIGVLAALSFGIYKVLLRKISTERHHNLQSLFQNLWVHTSFSLFFFGSYQYVVARVEETETIERILSYLGLITIAWGAVVFVKLSRILVYEYLFLGSMREGVPVLLVNLTTLLLSILLGGWVVTQVFGIQVAPLLATSAVFSIVLGLALQDTLGNLFAGMAIQFDKPYEIGDWIEVHGPGQKWAGQVTEITWRATMLLGLADEYLVIPNRVMAQAQISNFSSQGRPFIRSATFRVPLGQPTDAARKTILEAVHGNPWIANEPPPIVLTTDTHESWIPLKLVYFLSDYGQQFRAADSVIESVNARLLAAGIQLATTRVQFEETAPIKRS